jgi:hypothetical protein
MPKDNYDQSLKVLKVWISKIYLAYAFETGMRIGNVKIRRVRYLLSARLHTTQLGPAGSSSVTNPDGELLHTHMQAGHALWCWKDGGLREAWSMDPVR